MTETAMASLGLDEATIDAAIDRFYDRVIADPLLKIHFEKTNLSSKKASFKTYIMALLGHSEKYKGRTIYEAHLGRQITDLGFDYFVNYFGDALRELNVQEDRISGILAKLQPMKNDVVDSFIWPGSHFYKRD